MLDTSWCCRRLDCGLAVAVSVGLIDAARTGHRYSICVKE
jgi:hypothetical protein